MIYLSLFLIFFRIGIFGFGGGMAMLPLIFQSVQALGIMSSEEFANLVAISQVTPGPIAVNGATYVGYSGAGILGAFIATLAVTLPSFVIVIVTMKFIEKYKKSRVLEGVFWGIKPAVAGLISAAVVFMAQTVLIIDIKINWIPCIIFIITVILAGKFKISPIVLTIGMGIVGAVLCG